MSADYYDRNRPTGSPLRPLVGLIVLLLVGGFSYVVAPAIINWLSTTSADFVGRTVLPITFPAEWPAIVPHLVVALIVFIVLFSMSMIVLMAVMPGGRGELDVDAADVRRKKEAQRKYKKSRRRR